MVAPQVTRCPPPLQAAQGLFPGFFADIVDDQVDPRAIGQGEDRLGDLLFPVVDDLDTEFLEMADLVSLRSWWR